MVRQLFDLIGMSPEQCAESQRPFIATFAFGMVFAVGQMHQLGPPEVHALTIAYLLDVFGYSKDKAVAFAGDLIAASGPEGNPFMNAVIHRGIDGHALWQEGKHEELRALVQEILRTFGASG